MKRIFNILRENTLSQMFLFGFLMGVTGLLSNWLEWVYPVMIVCSIILAFYALFFIIAGIYNVIKELW